MMDRTHYTSIRGIATRQAPPRLNLTIFALVASGVLFALYPIIRPFSDETSLQGARAFASASWLVAHSLAMAAFLLLGLGLLGLYTLLRDTAVERRTFLALALGWVGAALTLPYYGAEVFGLHAVGQTALARSDASLLTIVHAVRWEAGIGFILTGLLLLAVSTILVATALWRFGGPARWGSVLLAVGFALYIPQFSAGQPIRVAQGLLITASCILLAWSMPALRQAGLTHAVETPEAPEAASWRRAA